MSVKLNKVVNAFIPGAKGIYLSQQSRRSIEWIEKWLGGLWVGGNIIVDAESLEFIPNAMNVAVHHPLPDISIPRSEIKRVYRVFGWFTGIVVVEHVGGEFRFRCYGAKSFATQIADLVLRG